MSDSSVASNLPAAPARPPQTVEPPVLPVAPEPDASPISVRNLSLAILATLVSIAALRLGSGIFVPLMLAVVASYALTPIVNRLERWHLPRALGAALVLFASIGGLGWIMYSHADDARQMIDSLPEAAEKLQRALRSGGAMPSPLERVEQAAELLQQKEAASAASAAASNALAASAAASAAGKAPKLQPVAPAAAKDDVMRVQVERPNFSIRDYVWTGTMGLVSAISQAVVVIVLTFFLLAAGSTFRRKMMKLAGPTLSEKKFTLEALDEVSEQIQRYLLVMVLLSVLTGFVTWAAFAALGVNNAVAWGVLAGALNMIPYLGSIVVSAAAMLAAFLQFGTIEMAVVIGIVCLGIHTVIGQVMTPWLTGRASHMNAVTMFVGVLALGWLWGLWGLFLAVPILVIVKVVCERIDSLQPIAEFLGE